MFAAEGALPFCPSQGSSAPPVKNCCKLMILVLDRAAVTRLFFELWETWRLLVYSALSDAGFEELIAA